MLHPEIADALREGARKYLSCHLEMRTPYCCAAEAGKISFDDIYRLGLFNAAGSQALIEKVDTGTLDQREMEKDPEVDKRGYALLADLLGSTPDTVEEEIWLFIIE